MLCIVQKGLSAEVKLLTSECLHRSISTYFFMLIYNKYLMTTPLKGLFSIMLKSHSPVKNPTWYGEFTLGITENKFIQ